MEKLKSTISKDDEYIDFEVTAHEVFGATNNEIIEAENEIVASNDININSEEPPAQIIETIADVDEEPVAIKTVKTANKAIYFVEHFKQFFCQLNSFLVMSYKKDVEYVIWKVKVPLGHLVPHEIYSFKITCSTKKSHSLFSITIKRTLYCCFNLLKQRKNVFLI